MSDDLSTDIRSRLLRFLTPAETHSWHVPDSLVESVDACFFDLDGVLYDHSPWRRWLLQLLGRMGLHTNYTAFFRLWDCEYGDDVAWGRIPFWDAMRRFLTSAGLSASLCDEVEAAGRSRFCAAEQQVRPFPSVLSTLRKLAIRNVQLNLVSAFPLTHEQLQGKLGRLGMSSLFNRICSARDWPPGTSPDLRFAAALEKARSFPARSAYIGRLKTELQAAARLGLQTISFNPEPDAVAHYQLEQFDHLPQMIPADASPLLATG
jgi:FMN phosphatase YigB (HAD superfamily)